MTGSILVGMGAWSKRKQCGAWLAGLLVCFGLQFVPFLVAYDVGELPNTLSESGREAFTQAHEHLMPLIHSRMFRRAVGLIAIVLVLVSGFPRWMEHRFGKTGWRWPARLLFFVAIFFWFRVTAWPFAWFAFLHDRAFDLTTQTGAAWWANVGKGLPIPLSLFLMRGVLLFCIMALCKRQWWWVAGVTIFLLFNVVPEKISRDQPIDLIEKREPLPEGEIRTQFEWLAEQTGRDLELVMVDQSKRSRRVNMALTGRLGREYVLVTDTLLNQLSPAEARAMLAHELGHDVTRHITVPARWTLSFAVTLFLYWIVHRWYRRQAVGESEALHAIVRLLLVAQLIGWCTTPIYGAVNRYQEREADAYAVTLTEDPEALASLLLTLAEINLEPYDVPRWAFYVYGSTHPTVRDRLLATGWSEGESGAERR